MSRAERTTIHDPTDPRLAPYAQIRERDLVGRHGRFIMEGAVTLRTALSGQARFRTESILLTPERLNEFGALIDSLVHPPPVFVVSRATMSVVAGFPIHRGVLAVGLRGALPEAAHLLPPPPRPATVIALVGLTNHDNVGSLFRNAAAFGADAVLLDETTCDPLYRKAIRVSVGAALTLPFARVPAETLLDFADRHALAALALTPGADAAVTDHPLPQRSLVLLGSEGAGLPPALIARTRPVRIGMASGFDSLNVATAGAIVLHHLWQARQASDQVSSRDIRLQLSRCGH